MRYAMQPDRVETWIACQDFDDAARGGVFVEDGADILMQPLPEIGALDRAQAFLFWETCALPATLSALRAEFIPSSRRWLPS